MAKLPALNMKSGLRKSVVTIFRTRSNRMNRKAHKHRADESITHLTEISTNQRNGRRMDGWMPELLYSTAFKKFRMQS